jgi:hypothetical protein
MSAMITSSEQASLTGNQPERKRDSFKQPHPFFFILSPEKESNTFLSFEYISLLSF